MYARRLQAESRRRSHASLLYQLVESSFQIMLFRLNFSELKDAAKLNGSLTGLPLARRGSGGKYPEKLSRSLEFH